MRFAVVWVGFCCWASVASAQVTFTRHDPSDDKVARALEQLIDQPVTLVDAVDGGEGGLARVSIDRAQATVRVVTRAYPDGLSRTLDPGVLARSPYAVALAAAELLDLSKLARNRARATAVPPAQPRSSAATTSVPASSSSDRTAEASSPQTVGATAAPPDRSAIERDQSRADVLEPTAAAAAAATTATTPIPGVVNSESEAAEHEHEYEHEYENNERASNVRPRSDRPIDTGEPAPAVEPRSGRRSSLPDFALEADVELQTQPAYSLSFLRPAVYGELAWGRDRPGLFWALGARVSAPLSREFSGTALQPMAASTATDHVSARALDAALQASLGVTLGTVGLAAHIAAGLSHLRVEAFDAQRRSLGDDAHAAPLLAAGLGARLPVAAGFALALRGEAQWAVGQATEYRVERENVFQGGEFRVGALAGILWESATGRAP